jgi:glutamate formiminotransferase
MLECVPNVAVGQPDPRLAAAGGPSVLDVHVDPDHQRTVVTLAGPAETDAVGAVRALAAELAAGHTFTGYAGVHPCLGVLDVVPFVALPGTSPAAAVRAATESAEWLAAELAVPVFLYGAADPERRPLPALRRDAFTRRTPDRGPGAPHPALGATAVGARPPLVAVNCELADGDVAAARQIAAAVRERDGGLPGVRALGLRLRSRGTAQVSMNVTALERTGVEAACDAVEAAARGVGARVAAIELVGLVPAAEYGRWSEGFRRRSGIGPDRTIEARLAAMRG